MGAPWGGVSPPLGTARDKLPSQRRRLGACGLVHPECSTGTVYERVPAPRPDAASRPRGPRGPAVLSPPVTRASGVPLTPSPPRRAGPARSGRAVGLAPGANGRPRDTGTSRRKQGRQRQGLTARPRLSPRGPAFPGLCSHWETSWHFQTNATSLKETADCGATSVSPTSAGRSPRV